MNSTLRSAFLGLCLGLSIIFYLENMSSSMTSTGVTRSDDDPLIAQIQSTTSFNINSRQAEWPGSILSAALKSNAFSNNLDNIGSLSPIWSAAVEPTATDPLADYVYTGVVNTVEGTSGLIEHGLGRQGWYVKEGEAWPGFPVVKVTNDEITLLVHGKPRTLAKNYAINVVQLAYSAPYSAPIGRVTADNDAPPEIASESYATADSQVDKDVSDLYVQDLQAASEQMTASLSITNEMDVSGDAVVTYTPVVLSSDADESGVTAIVELGERLSAESERLYELSDQDAPTVRIEAVRSVSGG